MANIFKIWVEQGVPSGKIIFVLLQLSFLITPNILYLVLQT